MATAKPIGIGATGVFVLLSTAVSWTVRTNIAEANNSASKAPPILTSGPSPCAPPFILL